MRKWWSSGIFFMPHPTTLGACRGDNTQLLKQHDKLHCACFIFSRVCLWACDQSWQKLISCRSSVKIKLNTTHDSPSYCSVSCFLHKHPEYIMNIRQDGTLKFAQTLTISLPLAMTSFSSTAVSLLLSDAPTARARASTKKAHMFMTNMCLCVLIPNNMLPFNPFGQFLKVDKSTADSRRGRNRAHLVCVGHSPFAIFFLTEILNNLQTASPICL